jgi:putative NIF3 family GTP cyclohydrolase 1 type 2
METHRIPLDELVRDLDELFSIQDSGADPQMSRFVPRSYQRIDYDYAKTFESGFCERFNGLMLRSGSAVKEVYCAAFPIPEILEKLLEATSGEALLFLHHPIDMEVSGVGWLPITPYNLDRLRVQGVSVYACHAPMDYHDELGTNASIVQAFDVQVEQHFAKYGEGFAGRIGFIVPADLGELVNKGKEVFGVDRAEIGGARPAIISKVAIVAGGGDDPEVLEEAERLGAEAYITGEWYTRTMPQDEGGKRWAEANRAACRAYAEASKMALLGFSHAATEYLVMKRQMAGYFRRRGLQVVCLEQSDWWR